MYERDDSAMIIKFNGKFYDTDAIGLHIKYSGKTYVPLQDAYIESSGTLYCAAGVCVNDVPDDDNEIALYMLEWDINHPNEPEESDKCDWDELYNVDDIGCVEVM